MPFLVNDTTLEREADVRTYLQSSVSLRLALRIVCTDGTVYAYTDAQNDVLLGDKSWGDITIPETLYKSGEGVFPSNIQQSRDPRKADTWDFKAFTGTAGIEAHAVSVEVPLNRYDWTDTGIVLNAGDSLAISASGVGGVNHGSSGEPETPPGGPYFWACYPEGTYIAYEPGTRSETPYPDHANDPGSTETIASLGADGFPLDFRVQNVGPLGLVGLILPDGETPPSGSSVAEDAFLIGREYADASTSAGRLWVLFNDLDGYFGDNYGSFSVDVSAQSTVDAYLSTENVSRKQLKGATFSLIIFCADADFAWLRQRGQVGDESLDKGQVTYKMNGLSQKWQTEVIEVTSPVSRAKWGDDTLSFFDLDGDTADGFAARVTGTASSIDSDYPRRKFVCGASGGFPEHRFTDGTCEFLSGENAGSTVTILNWSDDGTVLLDENAPFPIQAGDSVRLQIRAPKTIEEWILFFGDAKYFDGEAGIPGFEIASSIKRS